MDDYLKGVIANVLAYLPDRLKADVELVAAEYDRCRDLNQAFGEGKDFHRRYHWAVVRLAQLEEKIDALTKRLDELQATADPPPDLDLRTKEGREWRAKQKELASAGA